MKSIMPFNVRYAETDMMGVVHHANYPLYFEDARTRLLEEMGYPYAQLEAEGYMSPVVSLTLSYGKPLHYGDAPIVVTRVSSLTRMKVTFAYEVYESESAFLAHEKPNCSGESVHCIVERASFKPVNMQKQLPKLFGLYQQCLDEEQE